MFNVVTIAREYGSGGSDIAHKVAEMMGWVCIDKQIIEKVAAMGKVDPAWAAKADERVSSWWDRVLKSFRQGGLEVFVQDGPDASVDHDVMQQFTASVIQGAAKEGQCVIVGRSSQCVLHDYKHVLRVLVYAPLSEKLARMKLRHPHEHELQALLHRIDNERLHYSRNYYNCDAEDRKLYHLMINSTLGIDASARLIVETIKGS